MDIRKLQRAIVDGLEDVKAQDIVVFNTEALSPLFERVIIASGTSNRQTKALAASVRETVKARGLQVLRTEGEDNGEWIIVDCGAAVAHIMQPSIRDYYHLEEIWGGKPVHLKRTEVAPRGLPKASEEAPAPAAASRKTAAGKAAAKTATAKKAPSKSAPSKKAAAKKAPAKKAVGSKPGARAAAPDAGRAPARKTPRAGGTATQAAPRPPARKTPAAAPAGRKAAAPKAVAPKAVTRKAAAPRPAPAKTAAAPRKAAPRPAAKKSAAAAPRTPRRRV